MQGLRWDIRCLNLSFSASVFDHKVTTVFKAIEHVPHTQTNKAYSFKNKKNKIKKKAHFLGT